MANKVISLAKTLIEKTQPSNINIFAKGFKSPSDARGFGLTDPKNIAIANTFFSELNAREKMLIEETTALENKLGPYVPWSYFRENISDPTVVDEVKSLYDSVFEKQTNVPTLPVIDPKKVVNMDTIPGLKDKISKKIKALHEEIEYDYNPFLNPFSDFWVYGKDGPEFAEVFKARPKWNELINNAAEEFAFSFSKDEPSQDEDLVKGWKDQIDERLKSYVPNKSGLELIEKIADGKVKEELLEHYNNYLVESENNLLKEFTKDDNAGIALRTAWVSKGSDPSGKHFGGH